MNELKCRFCDDNELIDKNYPRLERFNVNGYDFGVVCGTCRNNSEEVVKDFKKHLKKVKRVGRLWVETSHDTILVEKWRVKGDE